MKKSRTKSVLFKSFLNLFIAIFLFSGLLVWRFSTVEPTIKTGRAQFSGYLLQVPKVYDRWQYFDIDGYGIKTSSELKVEYGDKLEINGVVIDGRITSPEIKIMGASVWRQKLFQLRQGLKAKIAAALPEPQSSLLAGIVLGSKEELPTDFKDALIKTGTIHVVVVSGYNISVIAGFLAGLALFIKRQYSVFICIIGIAFYTFLVGAEPPAVRAAIMGSLAFLATFFGRQRFPLYSLLLTAYIMILVSPQVVKDIGFQLSFLATGGIILFQNSLQKVFRSVPKPFGGDLSTTLAAQILVIPAIFYHFGKVSAISPVANSLILWIVPLATILGFIFLVVSFSVSFIAPFLALIIWVFLTVFVLVATAFSKIPFTNLNLTPGNLGPALLYYLVLGLIILYIKNVRMVKN